MRRERDLEIWRQLGRQAPAWAIRSTPDQADGVFDDAFWASGRAEVDAVFSALAHVDVAVGDGLAVDFGCGAGRLSRPLAERFAQVVGIDASPAMVAQATAHAGERLRFVTGTDLAAVPPAGADFLLCLLVLQHLRSAATIVPLVEGFVRALAPGGVAVFQVPDTVAARVRRHPLRLAATTLGPAWVRRLPRQAAWATRITPVPEARVREAVARGGVARCSSRSRTTASAPRGSLAGLRRPNAGPVAVSPARRASSAAIRARSCSTSISTVWPVESMTSGSGVSSPRAGSVTAGGGAGASGASAIGARSGSRMTVAPAGSGASRRPGGAMWVCSVIAVPSGPNQARRGRAAAGPSRRRRP